MVRRRKTLLPYVSCISARKTSSVEKPSLAQSIVPNWLGRCTAEAMMDVIEDPYNAEQYVWVATGCQRKPFVKKRVYRKKQQFSRGAVT
jgi:hypothetical protein